MSKDYGTPPENWREVYDEICKMKAKVVAPVDVQGCHTLGERNDPKKFRFQTLVALMLSSQTKDIVLGPTMRNLKEKLAGGLCLEDIQNIDEVSLNKLIEKVGFHNRKTIYLKQMARILSEKFQGDIPDTVEDLMTLPGVGPKMGYLCMSIAWNKTVGIGVDVHVHRICNLLHWCNTKTEEQTRAALQSWLPKELWFELNHTLVGFGQTICLPRGRRCDMCTLSSKGLCPSAFKEKSGITITKRKVKTIKRVKKRPASESPPLSPLSLPTDDLYYQSIEDKSLIKLEDLDPVDSISHMNEPLKKEPAADIDVDQKPPVAFHSTTKETRSLRRSKRVAKKSSQYFSQQSLQDIEDLV
ncbi:DNA endonuclease III [Schizosaccharomyces pombe]|uniref:Endonuclease III homolog n=1 Tax=Schizosaccharomyces pombe (strain 972 / ATCC 24843) TaxID=284812 RepID=NTH_SCHPO|nr:DNA endonuclease III [Schizosaccharomyces pombe]Q09907.1 RecName: Full=Endonuclease III homolog; AltName: Full=Bifunctional DNA N-glycosylase/DNA-(apurinic or apyrimidinic site) lyase; Short=DNA glycosylase/AP lyase [Schizosaccharomyces pombe 972h-]BAD93307.1 DNA endonuclease III [Schizosaccharomyces pombe]CAA91893.1 DNA endonuclease III [Schizosaccharomyces pombe]|eukprot:NP_593210.1 DNA endonuclease III [Schizosaccharomyces pombe]